MTDASLAPPAEVDLRTEASATSQARVSAPINPTVAGQADAGRLPSVPREPVGRRPPSSDGQPRVAEIDLRSPVDADLTATLRPFRVARVLTEPSEILQAQQLHASVYLANRFVGAGDLSANGTIGPAMDPWPPASRYFGVSRGNEVVTTARQITLPDARRLPALSLSGLFEKEAGQLTDLDPESVVEISALARARRGRSSDVVAIYSRMWHESLARRHHVWVMAVDLPLFAYLRTYFAGRAIRPIGPTQTYLGSLVMPARIWVDELNSEMRHLARTVADGWPLRPLLPSLFPSPAEESAQRLQEAMCR